MRPLHFFVLNFSASTSISYFCMSVFEILPVCVQKLVAVSARSKCTTDGKKCTGIKQINNQVGKIELLINFIFLLSDFEIQQRGSRHLPGHLVCQVCSQFVKGVGGRIFNNSNRQQRRFLTGSNPSGGKANKLGTYIILAFYKHTG